MAEFDVAKGLITILNRINAVCLKHSIDSTPRLVAVSKTKPKENVILAYEEGQRHFGENYIQELVDKSNDREILDKCPEICWHFIGNLQKNKVNKLISVPNLWVVETVSSQTLADALNLAWAKQQRSEPLKIMIQVNTSREEQKQGCEPENSCELVQHVLEKCNFLKFIGLMTIGQYDRDPALGYNPDFLTLRKCREEVCSNLNLSIDDIELSMGMSMDFEQAIELGSTNVRVGSEIFGTRNYMK